MDIEILLPFHILSISLILRDSQFAKLQTIFYTVLIIKHMNAYISKTDPSKRETPVSD